MFGFYLGKKMSEPNRYYCVFWTKTTENCAKILRVFGETSIVVIPSILSGCLVTELANYCFSPVSHFIETSYWVSEYFFQTHGGQTKIIEIRSFPFNLGKKTEFDIKKKSTITQLCGDYITHISLPDSLTNIGDYAFYNCHYLVSIEFGKCLNQIGSDIFMNCRTLQKLYMKCSIFDKTSLRRLLVQISWDVEVVFLGNNKSFFQKTTQIETVVFFPEYFEIYDEIVPAHVFGRQIIGGGFRARQCFVDSMINFPQYDAIFSKFCVEETGQTICHVSLCRLRYPVCLSKEAAELYKKYIYIYGNKLCQWLVNNKQLDVLSDLFHKQLLSQTAINTALVTAVNTGWAEGSASMLRWKQTNDLGYTNRRYEF